MWNSELVDDVPPDKVCALCFGDHGEWFCLYPHGEIIDRHNGELGLCPSSGKRADQIYPPLYKQPGANGRR